MNTKTINLYSILYLPILALVGMFANSSADAALASRVEFAVENKASQFEDVLGDASESGNSSATNSELAEMIRRQRAALDSADATANAKNTATARAQNGQNLCDGGLRACMMEKCGKDFTKCSGDGDTDLGIKLDACRAKTECTGEEYRLFTTEIKADIDLNAQMAMYNKTIECGNSYNACITEQCGGDKLTKCLGKAYGDAAIEKCKKIANDCRQADTGLANRMGEVFAGLRVDAEKIIKVDEERLYALRDKMKEQCNFLGAMFDERTFDCVYTVEFYAGGEDSTTPMASKKLYAGGAFNCDQTWFGIDATTFKENAYRFTRSQTSATSAFMGAGVGTAVGAVTSGAIGRAIDTKKAKDAMEDAQREQNGGLTDAEIEKEKQKDLKAAGRAQKKANRAARKSSGTSSNSSSSTSSSASTSSGSSSSSTSSSSSSATSSAAPSAQQQQANTAHREAMNKWAESGGNAPIPGKTQGVTTSNINASDITKNIPKPATSKKK